MPLPYAGASDILKRCLRRLIFGEQSTNTYSRKSVESAEGKALSLVNFHFTADVLQTALIRLIFADFF
jgi:hypothetical protein